MTKKNLKVILPVLVILLSLFLTVIIFVLKPEVETEAQEILRPQVRVTKAVKQDIQMIVKSQGTVRAKTESEIIAQVSGLIESVSPSFFAGGFFDKGDILVQLEARDYEYRFTQAQHRVTQAELALKLEEQQAEIAREEWLQMNDSPPPALVSREPQLAEARAALLSAKAGLAQAQLDLDRTKIRASFSGRLKTKNADIGRYVTPGMSLASVYSIDAAEIRLPLPDSELKFLDLPTDFRLNRNADIAPTVILRGTFAGSDHQWEGRLTHLEGEIDARSRMIHASVQVLNPYGKQFKTPLTAGMYVNAEIIGKTVPDLVVLPREVVRNDNQILIVDAENKLHSKSIGIYRIDGDLVYVDQGIENNEIICLTPVKTVVEGMEVVPVVQ